MRMLHRILLSAVTTAGLLFSAQAVWSAPPDSPPHGPARYAQRMERHRAELHDELKLTPQQESAWKTFTERTNPAAAPWSREDRAQLANLTAPERMERMLARMKEVEGRMAEHLAAVKEFYAVLTPEQRKVFDEHFNKLMGEHHRHWRRSGCMEPGTGGARER